MKVMLICSRTPSGRIKKATLQTTSGIIASARTIKEVRNA